MDAKAEKKKDKQLRKRVNSYRPGADYISQGGQEYMVKREGLFWRIERYNGGQMPPELMQTFTSLWQLEQELIAYLKRTDKGRARYPGKKSDYAPYNGEYNV